jgi:hypothetical protein
MEKREMIDTSRLRVVGCISKCTRAHTAIEHRLLNRLNDIVDLSPLSITTPLNRIIRSGQLDRFSGIAPLMQISDIGEISSLSGIAVLERSCR